MAPGRLLVGTEMAELVVGVVVWCGGGGVVEVMRWRWFGVEVLMILMWSMSCD
jgi:hypothetical protein